MPTKVKIVRAKDFLQTTPSGEINLPASRQMLAEVAAARRPPADFDILLDLRRAELQLSTVEVFDLAVELAENAGLWGAKIAILVHPGPNFNKAEFLETCSVNRGLIVDTFSDYETAIQWFFRTEESIAPPEDAAS